MLLTSLKRILRSGFVDFWRNNFVSIASVFVLTTTLFVIGSLVFLQAVLESTLVELQEKVDINVYFTTEATEPEVLAVQGQLEALPEVGVVEYVSRERALEEFRQRHADNQLTLQALDELESNPLGAALNIRAKQTSQYASIAQFLDDAQLSSIENTPLIDSINYAQNRVAIERLSAIISGAEKLGFGVTALLALLSVLITFNTIRLAIYTSRDEISLMRLVGASNSYIRGPFVIEGVLAGVSAGVIVLALFYPLMLWLGPISENFLGGFNLFNYYMNHFAQMALLMLGTGSILGGLSSFMAVKKYLKV
jgi:cell division transport system permease protein